MCDPVTLSIGLGLLTGGTYVQNEAIADRQDAMDEAAANVFRAEQSRQDKYDKERMAAAGQVFDKTAGRDTVDEQMRQAAEERLATQAANDVPLSPSETGYNASPDTGATVRNVQERLAANRADADAELSQQFGALAKLRSLGDAFQNFELFRQPAFSEINAINSFAQNSAGVAPSEAQAAVAKQADKNRNQELFGQIAAGLGSAAIGAGAGAGAGAGGTVASGADGLVSPLTAASLFNIDPHMYDYLIPIGHQSRYY